MSVQNRISSSRRNLSLPMIERTHITAGQRLTHSLKITAQRNREGEKILLSLTSASSAPFSFSSQFLALRATQRSRGWIFGEHLLAFNLDYDSGHDKSDLREEKGSEKEMGKM